MALAWVIIADMGMVLMIVVVPGLVVLGDTLLMPRMVGLLPAPLACVVVMMVVGLPSAEVTSFRMVPAGRGPFVCKGKQMEEAKVNRCHCQEGKSGLATLYHGPSSSGTILKTVGDRPSNTTF